MDNKLLKTILGTIEHSHRYNRGHTFTGTNFAVVSDRERDPLTRAVIDQYTERAEEIALLVERSAMPFLIIRHSNADAYYHSSDELDLNTCCFKIRHSAMGGWRGDANALVKKISEQLDRWSNQRRERRLKRVENYIRRRHQRHRARLQKRLDQQLAKMMRPFEMLGVRLKDRIDQQMPASNNTDTIVPNLDDDTYRFTNGLRPKQREEQDG